MEGVANQEMESPEARQERIKNIVAEVLNEMGQGSQEEINRVTQEASTEKDPDLAKAKKEKAKKALVFLATAIVSTSAGAAATHAETAAAQAEREAAQPDSSALTIKAEQVSNQMAENGVTFSLDNPPETHDLNWKQVSDKLTDTLRYGETVDLEKQWSDVHDILENAVGDKPELAADSLGGETYTIDSDNEQNEHNISAVPPENEALVGNAAGIFSVTEKPNADPNGDYYDRYHYRQETQTKFYGMDSSVDMSEYTEGDPVMIEGYVLGDKSDREQAISSALEKYMLRNGRVWDDTEMRVPGQDIKVGTWENGSQVFKYEVVSEGQHDVSHDTYVVKVEITPLEIAETAN